MKEKLVVMDGHSIINRAFYGVPDLTSGSGLHTNGIYGFLNILLRILEEENPQYLVVAFDLKEKTFRHKRYEAYKGTRKPIPPELSEQVPVLMEVLASMEIQVLTKPGYEADDILGTLATLGEKEGLETVIVSGDRDMLQLASDQVLIRIPKTKKGGTEIENYHTKEVVETYGITPAQIVDLKGLMGDASDNIPGIPGVGEKTATKMLQAFGTIENAYAHLEEVTPPKAQTSLRENYPQAQLSKELATICRSCPIPWDLEQMRIKNMWNEKSFQWFLQLGFRNLLKNFKEDMTKGSSLEENFFILRDLNEVEEYFASISTGTLGVFFTNAGKDICCVSCSQEAKTVTIPLEGFVTEELLKERLNAVKEKGVLFSVERVKQTLPYLEEKGNWFDCSLAAYLLNPLQNGYSLERLAQEELGLTHPSKERVLGKSTPEELLQTNPEEWYRYSAYQAFTAAKLPEVLTEKLKKASMWDLYEKMELPLSFTLFHMEQRGIRVNREELKEYGEMLGEKLISLEQNIYDLAGETFNIASPLQLGNILFDKLKLPYGKKTARGYSTSADILEKLQSQHPIVEEVLTYRQYAKLKSTYVEGLDPYIGREDSRIHATFHQTITATGRLSCADPNLQNIPVREELGRKIRQVFVPEEGYSFIDADYSQIELRLLAHMSGDEKLISAYQMDQDIHKITASLVFHVPLEEVTPDIRRKAKAVNFGIVYGISSFGLGQGLQIGRKEAQEYIENYFATYPGVKEYLDQLVAFAKTHGYVESLYHRIRPIPELSSSNFMQRSFGERVAMNSPLQGTAADIMKIAMLHVEERLQKEGRLSRMLLQVHDELLVETAPGEEEAVKTILKEEMMHAAELKVPLEVSISEGKNWYQAK